MLTLSERKRLQGLNGTVAKVRRTYPRMVGDAGSASSSPSPQGAAFYADDQDNLRAPRGIVYGLLISLALWGVAAWAWFA